MMDKQVLINVSDYGAFPNDGIDDTEAIRAAIYAASKAGGGIVQFEKGIYNIDSVAKGNPERNFDTLLFEGVNNVTIIGNGATLLLGNPYSTLFSFRYSSNIVVKDFVIDYAVTPWLQGVVSEINLDEDTFVLNADSVSMFDTGKTVVDDPRWGVKNKNIFGMVRRDEDPRQNINIQDGYFYDIIGNIEKLSDGLYKIRMATEKGKRYLKDIMHIGTKIVINSRLDARGAIHVSDSEGELIIEDLTVYASAGTMACIGRHNGDVTINNCKAMIKPDSGRWLTTNADGIYANDIYGKLTISNSLLEGLSDDTINIYSHGGRIIENTSNTVLNVKTMYIPSVGQHAIVIDHKNGRIRGKSKIIDVKDVIEVCPRWKSAVITLEEPIEDMVVGTDKDGDIIAFDESMTCNTVIKNNIFRYNNRAGIKYNGNSVTIENNVIEHTAFAGVSLYDIPSIPEIGPISSCKIINNKIDCCNNWLGNEERLAQIAIGARTSIFYKWGYGKPQGYMNKNIVVKDNVINSIRKTGIYVNSAENVQIENNSILGSESDTHIKNLGGVVLENVNNVQIFGNTINNSNPNMNVGIKILEKCKNISILDNDIILASDVQ